MNLVRNLTSRDNVRGWAMAVVIEMPVVSDQCATTVAADGSAARPRGCRIPISVNERTPVITCQTGGVS
jgi:hypothetical protein